MMSSVGSEESRREESGEENCGQKQIDRVMKGASPILTVTFPVMWPTERPNSWPKC